MHNFKDLKVWKLGIDISKVIFDTIQGFSNEHKFGISNQMFRAAVSIPSNIAEGSGRQSPKEFKQFLNIALGSSFELETQLIIAKEINLITEVSFKEIETKIIELQKMLGGLIKSIAI